MKLRRQRRTTSVAFMRGRRLIWATTSGFALVGVGAAIWLGLAGGTQGPVCPGLRDEIEAGREVAEIGIQTEAESARARADVGSDVSWEELLRLLASGAASDVEAARVEKLLKRLSIEDPRAAWEAASAEASRSRRLRWMSAVLEAWSAEAPIVAADWAMVHFQNEPDARDVALAGVVRGVAGTQDLRIAEALLERVNRLFPAGAETRHWQFVAALGEKGRHASAAAFAKRANGEDRGDLIQVAFESWAGARSEEAAAAALEFSDFAEREAAWDAVIARWAATDPEKLVMFAVELRDESARARALAQGLPQWILKNPGEATAWLAGRAPAAEFDAAAARAYLAKH